MLLHLLCVFNLIAKAQEQKGPGIYNDSLYTSSGMIIGKGQKVKLGIGTMPDGDFKFIRINSSSIFFNNEVRYYNSDFNANAANSMNRRQSGKEFTVVKIEKRGNESHGYTYYAVVAGMPRYEVDVENAIAAGELINPSKNTKGEAIEFSIADELSKLEKLVNEGVLTNDEFVAQKKKLLNKN